MQKKIIDAIFKQGCSMSRFHRETKGAPSYRTIRRIVHEECQRRQQGIHLTTPPERKGGRPPALSIEDRESIYNTIQQHLSRGAPFTTREEILKEAGIKVKKHKGEGGVFPQRVSDLKKDLGLSSRKADLRRNCRR
jgi:hypothetical protein